MLLLSIPHRCVVNLIRCPPTTLVVPRVVPLPRLVLSEVVAGEAPGIPLAPAVATRMWLTLIRNILVMIRVIPAPKFRFTLALLRPKRTSLLAQMRTSVLVRPRKSVANETLNPIGASVRFPPRTGSPVPQ